MFFPAIIFTFGLAIGSFFNVVIYRIPRNKSLLFPSSHCPACKKPIKFYDNIPVISYIILAGRCRYCQKPISPRYPVVELLTAVIFFGAAFKFGATLFFLRAVLFISFLIIIGFIDFEFQIAPFRITVPGLILGLITSFFDPNPKTTFLSCFLGMIFGGLFVVLAWVFWRYLLSRLFQTAIGFKQKEGIGWGDLPLTAMIGAFLGWQGLIVAIFIAVVSGVIIGSILRVIKKIRAGQPIAFGPFLAIGGLVALFWGDIILKWYLDQFFH